MATLVLTAVGTALGGPIGGAIGAIIGQQIDQNVLFKPKGREGPRLTDLAVQTSQYGSQIPRIYGAMRVAGSVIWATDLIERSERQGGGKGRPSVTTYSYSVSLAVALSSRPIQSVGRIWAEGNILRGSAGDLKTPVTLRVYTGHGDQPVDPLIASAEGAGQTPAHRGLAYAVLEDFDLVEYGNRIPSLSFEVFGDDGAVQLVDIIADLAALSPDSHAGQMLDGYAAQGTSAAAVLDGLTPALPLLADARFDGVRIVQLTDAAAFAAPVAVANADFAAGDSPALTRTRQSARAVTREIHLRYHDPVRDYQAGMRRSAVASRGASADYIELPAVLGATAAQDIADTVLQFRQVAQDRAVLNLAALDPVIRPGALVSLADGAGVWRVAAWEWRGAAVSLELVRHNLAVAVSASTVEPGRATSAPDALPGTTVLRLIDMPSGYGERAAAPKIGIAAAGTGAGWRGAVLLERDAAGNIIDTGETIRRAATIGTAALALPPSSPHLVDRRNVLDVSLLHSAMALQNADSGQLAQGANLVAVGNEILQFGRAEPLGSDVWRLSEFWRGRGGSEHFIPTHTTDEPFILLDSRLVRRDGPASGSSAYLALGQGDAAPVSANLPQSGRAVQPFAPVHGRVRVLSDNRLHLVWVRRSRAGHGWNDMVDVPLAEESESWRITLSSGPVTLARDSLVADYIVSLADLALLAAAGTDISIEIRQSGQFAASPPLSIFCLNPL